MRKLHALAAGRTARAANSAAVAVSARQRLLQPVDPSVRLHGDEGHLQCSRHLDRVRKLHYPAFAATAGRQRLLQHLYSSVRLHLSVRHLLRHLDLLQQLRGRSVALPALLPSECRLL